MFYRPNILLSTFAVIVAVQFAAHTGRAENDTSSGSSKTSLLVKIGGGKYTPELADAIIKLGQTRKITVPTDTSVVELIQQDCPNFDIKAYELVLPKLNPSSPVSFDKVLAANSSLTLPSCLSKASLSVTKKTISSGATVWDIFNQDRAGKTWEDPGAVAASMAHQSFDITNDLGDASYGKVVVGLNRDKKWLNSTILEANADLFVPTSELVLDLGIPKEASSELSQDQLVAILKTATADSGHLELADVGDELKPVETVDPSTCSPEDKKIRLTRRKELLYRLLKNVTIADKIHWKFTPIEVVIADSGVATGVGTPFENVVKNSIEQDVLPTDFQPLSVKVPGYNRQHGTQVASIAAGIGSIQDQLKPLEVSVTINPVRIYDVKNELLTDQSGNVVLDALGKPQRIDKVDVNNNKFLSAVSRESPIVVNLSVGRQLKIQTLESNLTARALSLYIVAAGNRGENLSVRRIYPAAYGGSNNLGRYNLITVASIDGDQKLSYFSNFGTQYVEIAANGCQIPVRDIDTGKSLSVSGTSFAAPAVSFVAALVRNIYGSTPASEVKNRLLASANIVPSLTDKVDDGRVLNPERAVSVFEDVVALKRGDVSEDIYGSVGKVVVSQICKTPEIPDDAKLLKLVRDFDGHKVTLGTTRVYWMNSERLLVMSNCESKDFSLQLREEEGDETVIQSDQVSEIVFATSRMN